MCGRFVQHSDPEIYASIFDLDALCEATPRYNLAPTVPVLAIRADAAGRRGLAPLRWGLVPSWSKGIDPRFGMINARAESVHEKPAYRGAFKTRRCVIPSEGFYEWRAEGRGKQPYLIRRRDGQPFAMAGLWETWHAGEPDELSSCTIIVTDANAVIRPIHDRMPVMLPREALRAWLDPGNRDVEGLRGMLVPAAPEDWTFYPVSKAVSSPRNEGPALIEAIGEGLGVDLLGEG